MKRVVVDCDGAIVPQVASVPEPPIRRSLNHRGQSANVNLQILIPATALLAGIDGRSGDLVRIASYVYAADQSVSRGGEADVYGDGWRRHFVVYIPVTDLEFWSQEPVSQALSDALGFVSGDVWNFQFSQAVPEQRQLTLDIDPSQVFGEPDSVYLFSGGLDSLAAVLEGAVQLGKKPLLVSHSPAFNIESHQRKLASAVRDRFQQIWSFPLIRVGIHRTGSDPSDYSQRTRSFLFASFSSAVANLVGLADVFLADNGVVSLNLPVNGQLVGAKASRSTHPKFLKLFNQLVAKIFPGGPTVKNPLWDRTRSETLKVIMDTGSNLLLEETNSCSHRRYRTRMQAHCGVCSQCIDRRFATLAAGLSEYDPPEGYRKDIFRQELGQGNDRTMALSYVRFAQGLEHLDGPGMFQRFPELFECIDPMDPDASKIAESLTEMLKRHGETVLQVMEEQISLMTSELARESLPKDCLIRLISGSSQTMGQDTGSLEDNSASSETESHEANIQDDAVGRTIGDNFRHSDDYREVRVGDRRFDLTTNQARVVELLHQQHLKGGSSLSQGYILETLDIRSRNMNQVFRESPAWRKLIVPAEGRGMYRLNITLR